MSQKIIHIHPQNKSQYLIFISSINICYNFIKQSNKVQCLQCNQIDQKKWALKQYVRQKFEIKQIIQQKKIKLIQVQNMPSSILSYAGQHSLQMSSTIINKKQSISQIKTISNSNLSQSKYFRSRMSQNLLQQLNDQQQYKQIIDIETKYLDEDGNQHDQPELNKSLHIEPMVNKKLHKNKFQIKQQNLSFSPIKNYHQEIKSNIKQRTYKLTNKNLGKLIMDYQRDSVMQNDKFNKSKLINTYLTNSYGLKQSQFYKLDYMNTGNYKKVPQSLINITPKNYLSTQNDLNDIQDILSDIKQLADHNTDENSYAKMKNNQILYRSNISSYQQKKSFSNKYKGVKNLQHFENSSFGGNSSFVKTTKLDQLLLSYQLTAQYHQQQPIQQQTDKNLQEGNSLNKNKSQNSTLINKNKLIQAKRKERQQRRRNNKYYQQVRSQIIRGQTPADQIRQTPADRISLSMDLLAQQKKAQMNTQIQNNISHINEFSIVEQQNQQKLSNTQNQQKSKDQQPQQQYKAQQSQEQLKKLNKIANRQIMQLASKIKIIQVHWTQVPHQVLKKPTNKPKDQKSNSQQSQSSKQILKNKLNYLQEYYDKSILQEKILPILIIPDIMKNLSQNDQIYLKKLLSQKQLKGGIYYYGKLDKMQNIAFVLLSTNNKFKIQQKNNQQRKAKQIWINNIVCISFLTDNNQMVNNQGNFDSNSQIFAKQCLYVVVYIQSNKLLLKSILNDIQSQIYEQEKSNFGTLYRSIAC